MSEPRRFNAAEVRACIDAGKIVCLGPHMKLARVGAEITGELQQSIVDMNAPPLSAVTLMLRKMKAEDPDLVVTGRTVGEAAARVAAGEVATGVSTKPLVESGNLLNSVDFRVE